VKTLNTTTAVKELEENNNTISEGRDVNQTANTVMVADTNYM